MEKAEKWDIKVDREPFSATHSSYGMGKPLRMPVLHFRLVFGITMG